MEFIGSWMIFVSGVLVGLLTAKTDRKPTTAVSHPLKPSHRDSLPLPKGQFCGCPECMMRSHD